MRLSQIMLLVLFMAGPLSGITDNELLLELEKLGCDYFWNEAGVSTGLVRDRANNNPSIPGTSPASISATGFGLTALCIAHSRKWLSYDDAYNRILMILNYFNNVSVEGHHGFYYHFVDIDNGTRYGTSELSSLDTALFAAGALFAGQYFKGTQIETVAQQLYQKINWTWMCSTSDFVSMGWKYSTDFPGGFTISYDGGYLCSYSWNAYNEGMLVDLLAIGSPAPAYLPNNSPNCWTEMSNRFGSFAGYPLITTDPYNSLFVHLYPQCWLDLRKVSYTHDSIPINYFTNSKNAVLANKTFTWTNKIPIPDRNPDFWGTSASYGPSGYLAYGAPPGLHITNDGTIVPIAAGGSVMITPVESIRCLRYMYSNYRTLSPNPSHKFYGRYGFSDYINENLSQNGGEVIGIDEGAIVLSLENYMSGMVWDVFMQLPAIQNALSTAGFIPSSDNERPSPISDLAYSYNRMIWTAPSDNSGKVKKYYLRYSKNKIINMAEWNDAMDIPNDIVAQSAGAVESGPVDSVPEGDYYFAVRSEDEAGNKSLISSTSEKKHVTSQEDVLFPNYPNPAKDSTTIQYVLRGTADVKLILYGHSGKILKEWVFPGQPQGYHQFIWNLKDSNNNLLDSGVYSLVLQKAKSKIKEIKIVVIR